MTYLDVNPPGEVHRHVDKDLGGEAAALADGVGEEISASPVGRGLA